MNTINYQNEMRSSNKKRIANYIYQNNRVTKQQLAYELSLSMPTVLSNMKELIEEGLIEEIGELESTGGRRAKVVSIVKTARFSIGIDITSTHVRIVFLDLQGMVILKNTYNLNYLDDIDYYMRIGKLLEAFINSNTVSKDRILGVGISLPGILEKNRGYLNRSHVLGVKGLSLKKISQFIPYPTVFRNDANSAASAEFSGNTVKNMIYLSLSDTIGGAVYLDGRIWEGDHCKCGEFGHMILVPGGTPCYCGKKGCFDSYCSAKRLSGHTDGDLSLFFKKVREKDVYFIKIWKEYLGYLAIAITNLRMAFDCDIILGGYIGGYMEAHMMDLKRAMVPINRFDSDTTYARPGNFKEEAAAVGAALHFIEQYFR